MTEKTSPARFERPNRPALAYEYTPNRGQGARYPLLMFCGGYRSDMNGTKASHLARQCAARGQPFLRFDYSGHGTSEGRFEDGTIGEWAQDAIDMLDFIAQGPVVVAGSSMGGWIALLLAKAQPDRVRGVIGIAAAPDFTETLFAERLNDTQRHTLMTNGLLEIPGNPGEAPLLFTKKLYEEGKNNLLLDRPQSVDFPIKLIQGMQDVEVPWETSVKIQKNYRGADVDIIFIEDGDHRLSRPEDLDIIDREIRTLSGF
ncbi:MAG: alpha/beta hydrolase [Alphaproteobacteria bacterium]|nr:alpha/beta hydrolase [Alphaproteobacteria bacterium]